jgi:hypothetical protein
VQGSAEMPGADDGKEDGCKSFRATPVGVIARGDSESVTSQVLDGRRGRRSALSIHVSVVSVPLALGLVWASCTPRATPTR